MNSRHQRIGKFSICLDIIEDAPNEVLTMFHDLKIIPVRAENLYGQRVIEYVGISEKFAEVELGCMTPEYIIVGQVEYDEAADEKSITYKAELLPNQALTLADKKLFDAKALATLREQLNANLG